MTFKTLITLGKRAPDIIFSSFIYVFIGLIIGCIIEHSIMPAIIHPITNKITCKRCRALINLTMQCSFTAILAEYLKIMMNNKGSPGAICLGIALFAMQKSIKDNIAALNLC